MKVDNQTKRIRVGIIGCGKIALDYHIPCYNKLNVTVVSSLCDTNKRQLASASKKLGIKNTYNNIDEFLEKEKPDMVDICTPGFTHYEVCKKVIESGARNILVEKPLTLNLHEAVALGRLSEQRGTRVCIVHNIRFMGPFLKLMEMYNAGKIGEIYEVLSINHGLAAFDSYDWRRDERKSGGLLYEAGIHLIDFQVALCGRSKQVISVHRIYDHSLDYTTGIYAMVEYENGAIGIIDLAAFSSSTFSQFHVFGSATDVHIKLFPDYFGTSTGSLYFYRDFLSESSRVFRFIWNFLIRGKTNYNMAYHFPIISAFIESIKKDEAPPISVSDVLPTMELLNALKETLDNL